MPASQDDDPGTHERENSVRVLSFEDYHEVFTFEASPYSHLCVRSVASADQVPPRGVKVWSAHPQVSHRRDAQGVHYKTSRAEHADDHCP